MSIQWLLLSHAIARSLAAECVLDSELYNPGIFPTLAEDFPAAIVAPLCGRNRGAFATDPPDGHTYSCVTFPGTNGTWGGAAVKDANAIKTLYDAGKLSDDAAVGVLDAFVRSVYASGDKNQDDPGACEVNGMAKLTCDDAPDAARALPWAERFGGAPIRAVTLAGVLADAPFAGAPTYDRDDFAAMAALGLNAVKIPVDASRLADIATTSALISLVSLAADARLGVLLAVVDDADADDAEVLDAANSAVAFVCSLLNEAVFALSLPAAAASRADVVAALPEGVAVFATVGAMPFDL